MYVLMQCVAEAVVAKGVRGLAELVPGGAFLYDVANEAHKRLRDRKRADQIREEVVAVAAAGVEEVRKVAEQVVAEVAKNATPSEKAALELYLTQVPGAVRQSFRRAEDPSGKSVPDQFALNDGGDLARRLPSRLPKFRPGDPLPGRPGWVVGELLGSGGFGEVWLARNPSLAALKGAVKFGTDPQARERLLRHEGGLVSRVMEEGRHPNIVPLLDAYLEGETPWLMYEYISGGELGNLIGAWQALPPADRTARAATALRTLAAAVGHFHRLHPPLVHRDLKPANILVRGSAGNPQLLVADFGIGGVAADAALAAETNRRSSGYLGSQLWGSHTPLYASPQQQRGEKPDPRDDVHALGVIGYQILTGKLDTAPGADFARTLRRLSVPESLIELLGDCAAHDPAHRPKDATELADRLGRLDTPGAAAVAPPTEAPQIVACPSCGVSLRFRAGATALRCVKCGNVFNPSAPVAPPPPPVVEARLSPPTAPSRSDTQRAVPLTRRDDRRDRDRERDRDRDRDRDRRRSGETARERPRKKGGVPAWLIVGGSVFGVLFLVVLLFALRTPRPLVIEPSPFPQPQPAIVNPSPRPSPIPNPVPVPSSRPGTPIPVRQADPVKHLRSFAVKKFEKADYVRHSPDGQKLLGVTPDGDVTVATALDGSEVLSFPTGTKGARPVFIDGLTLVTPGFDRGNVPYVYVVNLSSGIGTARALAGLGDKVTAVAAAADGKFIAAGGEKGGVVVWNAADFTVQTLGTQKVKNVDTYVTHPHPGAVTAVAFTTGFGREVVTAGGGTVRTWGERAGRWDQPPKNLLLPGDTVFSLTYGGRHGRDGVTGGSAKQGVWTWEGRDSAPVGPAPGSLKGFTRTAAGATPFAQRYAAIAGDGKLGFWTGQAIHPIEPVPDQPLATDLAFNKEGNLLAVAHKDGTVGLWFADWSWGTDMKLAPMARLTNHGGELTAVSWSPDGKELATADKTGRVRIWGDFRAAAAPAGTLPEVRAP